MASAATAAVPAECASFALLEKDPCTKWLELTDRPVPFFDALAVGVDAAKVSVRVTVDPQPSKVGAPIAVVVTYVNASDKPIALDFRQGSQSKKRGDNMFGYAVFDEKGKPAEEPPGPSPCCPPGNTSDLCGDVPLENPSLASITTLRALLPPHAEAKVIKTWAPTRKKYGPKSQLCPSIEVGPLLPGDYTVEVELPWPPNMNGSFARSARASFSITK